MRSITQEVFGKVVEMLGDKDADIFGGACLLRPVYQASVSEELLQEMLED